MAADIGYRNLTLQQLEPNLNNVIITGIIIGKQQPRSFSSRQGNQGGERAVWNFTFRDSPQDYINVACWGNREQILKMWDTYRVGDIVQLIRPKIDVRSIDDNGERFRPMVTSPYTLSLQEDQSRIVKFDDFPQMYRRLLHYPTKPIAGFVTLADIQNAGPSRIDKHVDILIAVCSIGPVRSVKSKTSMVEYQLRDISVIDHSISENIKISIWDPELMARAGLWKPRLTVLFMTDTKIEYSQFHKACVPNITSKTIITEDPIGYQAESLRHYALTAPLNAGQVMEKLTLSVHNPLEVQNVMTTKKVLDKITFLINSLPTVTNERCFTALLYVFVTQLDLDGFSRVTSARCSRCKFLVRQGGVCENQDCVSTRGCETVDSEISFDIRVNLTDHTGSLNNCNLFGNIAEQTLNCSIEQFMNMTDEEKCELKWKYLMERCAVRILVLCTANSKVKISVLSCMQASYLEVANKLPQY